MKKCICWCLSIIELKNTWWNIENDIWFFVTFSTTRPSVLKSNKLNWAFYIWCRNFVGYLCCPLFLCRAAICCVGCMYEKLGRMMGRSYEETVQILIKSLRNAESQTRIEIMLTLEKVTFFQLKYLSSMHWICLVILYWTDCFSVFA